MNVEVTLAGKEKDHSAYIMLNHSNCMSLTAQHAEIFLQFNW